MRKILFLLILALYSVGGADLITQLVPSFAGGRMISVGSFIASLTLVLVVSRRISLKTPQFETSPTPNNAPAIYRITAFYIFICLGLARITAFLFPIIPSSLPANFLPIICIFGGAYPLYKLAVSTKMLNDGDCWKWV